MVKPVRRLNNSGGDVRIVDYIYMTMVIALVVLILLLLMAAMASSKVGTCVTFHDVDPSHLDHKMDGDTIAVKDLGPMMLKFRVQDIDTPERADRAAWAIAREFAWEWLHQGPFDIHTCWKPTLDRYVGIISRNGSTLASALAQAGLAKE